MNNTVSKSILAGAAMLGMVAGAQAVTFNFSGTSGSNGQALAATAEFLISGTTVTIKVTNTGAAAANDGANVLGGVYFNLASARTFSNGNAALGSGANLVKKNDNSNQSGNPLNNEWMWNTNIVSTGGQSNFNAGYGIGATGFNFSPNNSTFNEVFYGGNVMAGANDDYGLVPTLGMTAGNQSNLYMRNQAVFTFTVNSTFSEADITSAYTSWGSAGQSVITGSAVPEPASMAALGLGLAALLRKRRK